MRIGVTGAKGFIGTHLLPAIKDQGTVLTLPRRKGFPGKQELKRFVTNTDLSFILEGSTATLMRKFLVGISLVPRV